MCDVTSEEPSEPHFELAGFKMRVLRREFPEGTDYWDGNWLFVSCECSASGARVFAQGPFIHISEIKRLAEALDALASSRSTKEDVNFLEPELSMKFSVGSRGHVEFSLRLTPDHMSQSHRFVFGLDLSYLPIAIKQCQSILTDYPLRGTESS